MWLIVLSVVTLLFVCWKLKRNRAGVTPKGPKGWPVIGNTLQVNPEKIHFTLDKWSKQFGPIYKCNILRTNMLVLSSPDLIRKAFGSDEYGKIFNDRPESFVGKYCLFNNSGLVVTHYNDILFKLRKAFHTALHLHGDGMPRFEHAVKTEIAGLIDKIKQFEGKDFEPGPVFERSLGNLLSILVCGEPMTENDVKIVWDYVKTSVDSLTPTIESILFTFPFLRFIPGKCRSVYLTLLKTQGALIDRYLKPYQNTYSPDLERGLVDAFIRIQKEEMNKGSSWLNDDRMKGLVEVAIAASLITTISAMTSIFLAFINNVSCADRIYQEIESVVGKTRQPVLSDKAKMPYTEAALMECLRIASTMPTFLPHNCMEDCVFEGYKIRKGTKILANLWTINRDPEIWGDPEVFRPERFLDADGDLLPPENKLRQACLLFGVGRRSCVGEVMARPLMFLYVTSLIQKFRFLPPAESQLMSFDPRNFPAGIVMRPAPYKCRAEIRV